MDKNPKGFCILYRNAPQRLLIPNSGISSLNALCPHLTPCPLSFKGEEDMGVRSLKMKLQAFPLLRNLFRPLWYYQSALYPNPGASPTRAQRGARPKTNLEERPAITLTTDEPLLKFCQICDIRLLRVKLRG